MLLLADSSCTALGLRGLLHNKVLGDGPVLLSLRYCSKACYLTAGMSVPFAWTAELCMCRCLCPPHVCERGQDPLASVGICILISTAACLLVAAYGGS